MPLFINITFGVHCEAFAPFWSSYKITLAKNRAQFEVGYSIRYKDDNLMKMIKKI